METEDLTSRAQALEFTNEEYLQAHQNEILRVNEEVDDLIAKRHLAHCGCFDSVVLYQKE